MKKNTEYTITAERVKRDPTWVKGTIGAYTFEAKVFDTSSCYGIDEGRVSKLWIWDNVERRATGNNFNDIIAYDREWDHQPKPAHKALYRALLAYLETLPAVYND